MTHAEMITALEAATEPSRGLDAEIARAIGLAINESDPEWVFEPSYLEDGHLRLSSVQPFTSSIDAALTLLNKVGILLSLSDIGADGLPLAIVADPTREVESTFEGIGCNLAISLCIAALKAREAAP